MKSQLSLEFLIILAALALFLLAFLPVYAQAQKNAKEKLVGQAQALAFSQITGLAAQAETLGRQNSLSAEIRFQADSTSLEYDGQAGILKMIYSLSGKTLTLEEKLSFPLDVPQSEFEKGAYTATASFEETVSIQLVQE